GDSGFGRAAGGSPAAIREGGAPRESNKCWQPWTPSKTRQVGPCPGRRVRLASKRQASQRSRGRHRAALWFSGISPVGTGQEEKGSRRNLAHSALIRRLSAQSASTIHCPDRQGPSRTAVVLQALRRGRFSSPCPWSARLHRNQPASLVSRV